MTWKKKKVESGKRKKNGGLKEFSHVNQKKEYKRMFTYVFKTACECVLCACVLLSMSELLFHPVFFFFLRVRELKGHNYQNSSPPFLFLSLSISLVSRLNLFVVFNRTYFILNDDLNNNFK